MLETLKSLLGSQTNLFWVTVISLLVSSVVSLLFRRWETRDRLETEYKYEQRKKLRELIGRYHGRVLTAAVSMNLRFFDLYDPAKSQWLGNRGQYFDSSVYRFMNVCSVIRQFEREALYVDGRIADERDFLFVKYLNALRLCMTDVELFKGLSYDVNEIDHFFADEFRERCDSCIDEGGNFIDYGSFKKRAQMDEASSYLEGVTLKPVLDFFDSLAPDKSLRWDRLVAFHLILAGLINAFGYPEQEISKEQIRLISEQFVSTKVLENLRDWLPKRGLAEESLTKTITCLVPKFI